MSAWRGGAIWKRSWVSHPIPDTAGGWRPTGERPVPGHSEVTETFHPSREFEAGPPPRNTGSKFFTAEDAWHFRACEPFYMSGSL